VSSAVLDISVHHGQARARERWVLVAAVITTGMAFLDATALNAVLPAVQVEFGATAVQLLWIVNAYGLFATALLLLGGALGDRLGRQRVYLAGILGFATASAACGLAGTAEKLIVMRAMQGIAAALMIPGSLAMITAAVPQSRRGRAIGIWTACSVVTTALGPVLGGWLVRVGWWRGVLLINVPLAAVAAVVVILRAVESRAPRVPGRVDLWGAWWSVCGLAALNWSLLEASGRGLTDPQVAMGLCLGAGSLVLFVAVERRAADPILPLRLFRSRTLRAVCLVTLLVYASLYGMTLLLVLNLIQLQHYSALAAGLALLPVMLMVVVLAAPIGRMMDRHGPRGLLTVGSLVAGIGYLGLMVPGITAGPTEYAMRYLVPLLLVGIGMSLCAVPLSTTLINTIAPHQAGLAAGLNSVLSRLSSVLGVAVLGAVSLTTFRDTLTTQTAGLPLTAAQQVALRGEAAEFGSATPPEGLPPSARAAVVQALQVSFVRAFRTSACVCAGASFLAALIASSGLKRGAAPGRQHAAS
jgi:EmrB/QacA subfamily drug resistance transporter